MRSSSWPKALRVADSKSLTGEEAISEAKQARGTVEVWCTHFRSCVQLSDPDEACRIASTYLDGEAFNLWHTYSRTMTIATWDAIRAALIRRCSPLNEKQAARDKLHSWRQIKDVGMFNRTFLTVLDILDNSAAEMMDLCSRGL